MYQKIIDFGRLQPKLSDDKKGADNIVHGCQSSVYLHTYINDGCLYFKAESDALISSGLAALLTTVYSGEEPETVLQSTPSFLEEMGIPHSLTPSRANGLYSIHLRIKQDALQFITH